MKTGLLRHAFPALFPLLSEEGWLRAFFARRRGGEPIVKIEPYLKTVHHPVRSAKVASQHLTDVAATPPRRGGERDSPSVSYALSRLLLLILLAAITCNAQTKRAMTVDDLITTIRVSDPQLTPDSKQVLFTRTTTALDSGKRNSDIWIVAADGSSSPREFIGGEKSENTARFT